MTEEEAKTKWCPYARVVMGDAEEPAIGPFNRDHWINDDNLASTIHRSTCIGSACMAWRWVPKSGNSKDGKPNYYAGNWKGFCGLAGKP